MRSQIAALNDAMRHSFGTVDDVVRGLFQHTAGLAALGDCYLSRAYRHVIDYDSFTADDDPHGEYDFGSFELGGDKLFWKIDCYAKDDFSRGSEDPADPEKTTRVLTIMLASEYRPGVAPLRSGADPATEVAGPSACGRRVNAHHLR